MVQYVVWMDVKSGMTDVMDTVTIAKTVSKSGLMGESLY